MEIGVHKFSKITEEAISFLYDPGITRVWYTEIIEYAVPADYRKYGIFYYLPGDTFRVPEPNNPLD